jgi:transcriptional regulator with XRE-family HTH domain
VDETACDIRERAFGIIPNGKGGKLRNPESLFAVANVAGPLHDTIRNYFHIVFNFRAKCAKFCVMKAQSPIVITGSARTAAQNIKRARINQNISQVEVAKRVGLSLRSYQTFEASGEIRLMKFLELLRVLGRLSAFVDAATVFQPRSLDEARQQEKRRRRASPRAATKPTLANNS